MLDHGGAAGAAVVAGLDGDADWQAFLHRHVRLALARGETPAEIRTECRRIDANFIGDAVGWTGNEINAFETWHAAHVDRCLATPLTSEN